MTAPTVCVGFAVAALLCGCVAPSLQLPGPETATITTDKFSPNISILGATESATLNSGETVWRWSLGSAVDKKTGALVTTQLFAHVSYVGTAWCHYDQAADDTAKFLRLRPGETNVHDCDAEGSCIFEEDYAVDVQESLLASRASAGYQIKISSDACDAFVVNVSSAQIAAQLSALSRITGSSR